MKDRIVVIQGDVKKNIKLLFPLTLEELAVEMDLPYEQLKELDDKGLLPKHPADSSKYDFIDSMQTMIMINSGVIQP